MQHNKITTNPAESQKFINNDKKTGICLEGTIKTFNNFFIFIHVLGYV